MKISNWDKWQTYRSDRNTPPWIKVHRNLFSNPEWFQLSDSEKGQLISIWILAADKCGEIPDDFTIIQRMCGLEKKPNINKFIELGFIDAKVTPSGCHVDAKVTHQTRLDQTRLDQTREEGDKKKQFSTPSLNQIKELILEKGYFVCSDTFFNFYESNGWKVGRNKMKSWEACLAKWNSQEKGNKKFGSKNGDVAKRFLDQDTIIEGEYNVVK